MGQKLVQQMLPVLQRMEWTGSDEPTAQGRIAYDIGRAKVDSYERDTQVLGEALRTFQTSHSRPYAYAGIAYTLMAAARDHDGSYAPEGLTAAMEWLERAQELAPDLTDINTIEAFIYVYQGRYDDARLVLDYLKEQSPDSLFIQRAEIAYHQEQGHLEETILAYKFGLTLAHTPPERMMLRRQLADCYLHFGHLPEALTIYRELVHFSPDDPDLWHRMSTIYFRQENFREAAQTNERALSLLPEYQPALDLKAALQQRLGSGFLNRLFGI